MPEEADGRPPGAGPATGSSIEDSLIQVALSQIQTQHGGSDSHDAKAMGVLAGLLAAAALAVATQPDWSNAWIPAVIGLGVTCACIGWTIKNRRFSIGPDIRHLYQRTATMSSQRAQQQILTELLRAVDENNEVIKSKGRWYARGLRVGGLTVILGALAYVGVYFWGL